MARGLPTGGQGSKVYVLCAEPKEHKHFRPGTRPGGWGTRPGGSVTGVTEKSFMCQMFMCLISAIGNTISCDAPYSAIGFRGKLFLRYPPSKAWLWTATVRFYGKKWGCSGDSLRYPRKHSATRVLLHLSRDRGGGISVGSLSKSCDASLVRCALAAHD